MKISIRALQPVTTGLAALPGGNPREVALRCGSSCRVVTPPEQCRKIMFAGS